MPDYRRLWIPGGTYFFTVVTYNRMPILCGAASREALRKAVSETRKHYPYETLAWVLLPDHLHCIWRLPGGDADFSTRWRLIKARFSRAMAASIESQVLPNASRRRHGERHIWQRRFWEHCIRDQQDLNRHIQYIHYNPVKHGLIGEAEQWPYSTFNRFTGTDRGAGRQCFDKELMARMECE